MNTSTLCTLFQKMEAIEATLMQVASADQMDEDEAAEFLVRLEAAHEFLALGLPR